MSCAMHRILTTSLLNFGGSSVGRCVVSSFVPLILFGPFGFQCTSRMQTTLFSTSFHPPEPPSTKGTPIFPDIDLSFASDSADALSRNEDPDAVMVVTGANRGIGFHFVIGLVHRTKVSSHSRSN
jgi:hypothetical protein